MVLQGFPTLKLFPAGPKSDSSVKDYEGPRSADEIVKFALEFYRFVITEGLGFSLNPKP